MRTMKSLIPYLFLIGIILFLIFTRNCDGDKDEPKNPYSYKTDTIIKKSEYKLLLEDKDKYKALLKTPPKVVTKWLTPKSPKVDSVRVNENAITFYSSGLQPIILNKDYVLNYTQSSKLLRMELVKDNLQITTMDPSSSVETKEFPLFLDQYGYLWNNNTLTHYELETKKNRTRTSWNEFYINGGYSILAKAPEIGIEYNLRPGRFKIDISSDLQLKENPQIILNAKLGYRLFK